MTITVFLGILLILYSPTILSIIIAVIYNWNKAKTIGGLFEFSFVDEKLEVVIVSTLAFPGINFIGFLAVLSDFIYNILDKIGFNGWIDKIWNKEINKDKK